MNSLAALLVAKFLGGLFSIFGHQLSVHLKPEEASLISENNIGGKQVPVRHFGIILGWKEWHKLVDFLKEKQVQFIIEPYIRFKGEVGEQATMFFLDPSNNAIELKSFKDTSQLFAA